MSTYYRPTKSVDLKKIKKIKGLSVVTTKEGDNLLEAKGSYLHYDVNRKNKVIGIFRYGSNNADDILDLITEKLGIEFVSEHEYEYDELRDKDSEVISVPFEEIVIKKAAAKRWTKAELSILKKEYPRTETSKLAKRLKRTLEAVRFQAKKHGLKKTKEKGCRGSFA